VTPKQHIEPAKTPEGRHDAPGHTEDSNEALQKEIAGRRQAEEARRPEMKFRTFYDLSSDALLLSNENGSFVDCNLAGLAMFGCATVEEFRAKHPADLSPPTQPDGTDSRTLSNRHIATALEKGSHRFEWWHKRNHNGEAFPAEVHLTAMTLDDKRVLLGIVQDITGRKQAEQSLARSELRLRTLIEKAPMGISISRNGIGIYANPKLVELFRLRDAEECVGRSVVECFAPQCREESKERSRRRSLGLPVPVEYEAIGLRSDGSQFPIHVTVAQVQLEDGMADIAFLKDITERKRAEEALRESEAKLRGVFECSRDAIGISRDGVHEFANAAFLEMFGLENIEQLAGTSILSRIAPSHRQQVLDYMERRAAGEDAPTLYESRGIKSNGREFDLEIGVSTYPFHGQIYTIGIIRDITERKQAEMRMQVVSREIVTARENEKRHLSSILHHDLGSLAVGVSAYLDAIEEDLRSEQPGKALRWMKRTRKLFDKSLKRLKGLAVELRPPELDVLGLGAALRQHFSLVTKRGGIRIRFREGQHGKRLIGDTAIVLFRVAQEALTNAITHGHAKRAAVDLLTLKKEVRLTIRDNGKGFDPSGYMKLPISHLGLRVMREMTEFVGGAFTIDSRPGHGTTVRLTLPIQTAGSAVRSSRTPKGSRP
jgi:PAS domain S-box-containing protein